MAVPCVGVQGFDYDEAHEGKGFYDVDKVATPKKKAYLVLIYHFKGLFHHFHININYNYKLT